MSVARRSGEMFVYEMFLKFFGSKLNNLLRNFDSIHRQKLNREEEKPHDDYG